jgi:hypothetical protein
MTYLHSVLQSLAYRYSTSTMPRFGLRHGPISRRFGLPEFPLTGAPESPHELLDTWGFFAAPDRVRNPDDYVRQARILADSLAVQGAGVINVYGDPSHVHERSEFFEAIKIWVGVAEPISYSELLDRIQL